MRYERALINEAAIVLSDVCKMTDRHTFDACRKSASQHVWARIRWCKKQGMTPLPDEVRDARIEALALTAYTALLHAEAFAPRPITS